MKRTPTKITSLLIWLFDFGWRWQCYEMGSSVGSNESEVVTMQLSDNGLLSLLTFFPSSGKLPINRNTQTPADQL